MSTEVLEKIKSRGHWQVIIRPAMFAAERIQPLAACQKLVEKNKVQYRGSEFPDVHPGDLGRGLNFVESIVTFGGFGEAWRLYQSAQFAFLGALREDWTEDMTWLPPQVRTSIKPGAILDILSVLYRLSEIYEFAARLAQEGIFDDTLFLSVDLVGTEGRQLFFWSRDRPLWHRYICNASKLPREKTFTVTDLIAHSREHSFEHFLWLMERFGFDASPDVFKRDQEKFFQGRY